MLDRRTAPGLRKHPEELRRRAYELYAGEASGNLALTQRLLSAEIGETLPHSTLQKWRDSERWLDRQATETLAVTQLDTVKHVRLLSVAGGEAVSFLRSLTAGYDPDPESNVPLPERIRVAVHLETAARSLILKQADQQKHDGRSKRPPPRLADSEAVDVVSMSSAELEAYEQRLRDRANRD